MEGKSTPHLKHFEASKKKPNETILCHLEGWIGDVMGKGAKKQHNGQLILTDERVCFCRKGLFGEVFEAIPISKMTSVETQSFMGHRTIRVHTSHDDLTFKTFEQKVIFSDFCEDLERRYESRHSSPSTIAAVINPASGNSDLDIPLQIKKLAELRDSGVLSIEEFESKKTELLARM